MFDRVQTPVDIFSVAFEFNLADRGAWTSTASSLKRNDNFAVSWQIAGFNPFVRATPNDSIGIKLTFSGPDDPDGNFGQARSVNIAFVPLPAGGLLGGSALIGLVAFGPNRRRSRRRDISGTRT